MIEFIKNYNVVNAYVDTSFVSNRTGEIIVSSFSSEDGNKQEYSVKESLRVTANDGFKFDLEHLEDYYFDIQFQRLYNNLGVRYNSSLPFTRVHLSEFVPVTDISYSNWFTVQMKDYPLYQGIKSEGSMYYTFTVENTEHLILLYGGLRERDLLFLTFARQQSEYNSIAFTMNGKNWAETEAFYVYLSSPDPNMNGEKALLNNLNFVAIPSGSSSIEDTTKYLFTTYYINNSDLSSLRENSGLVSEVIINTYSFPLNFAADDLVEVDFSVANINQSISAMRFLKNHTEVEIFKFTIPDVPNVSEVRVRIPFNNDVVLNYEDVRGKTITGKFVYEVLTNSTTLFISDGTVDIYKVMVGIGVVVPYKPTGYFDGGRDPVTRLAIDEPKLFIKGVGKTVKGNYIKGRIKETVENMLNSEREKLNSLLRDGVYFND